MKAKSAKKKRIYSHSSKKKPTQKLPWWYVGLLLVASFIVLGATIIIGFLKFTSPETTFCANSVSCIKNLSGKISTNTTGFFMGKKVTAPNAQYFAQIGTNPHVLGAATGVKHIYVDLSSQHLYAYQGNTLVYNFPVSTGKWHLTPTGTFHIWIKLVAVEMAGGEGADAYDLPNVPWTMFFANAEVGQGQGFSLHGAYWHENFGYPMSHGCVNIAPLNAKLLFDWANPATKGYTTYPTSADPGTLVTIYGVTPNEDLRGSQYYNNNISPDAGSAQ
jgi:lipoprotein-anchoring transpeptidase ErfK/SrfK